jgi:hypothetical protein
MTFFSSGAPTAMPARFIPKNTGCVMTITSLRLSRVRRAENGDRLVSVLTLFSLVHYTQLN